MPRGPGRPSNGSLMKMIRLDPELEILVNRRLTQPGQDKPQHGAWSGLVNSLLRKWISEGTTDERTKAD